MKIFGVTLLVLSTLGLAACGGSSDDSSSTSDSAGNGATKEKSAGSGGGGDSEGQAIFTANCASCHTLSAAGAAGAVGPNLDEAMPSEATVKTIVTNGGNGMPSFSSTLDSGEIDAVSKYVSTAAGS